MARRLAILSALLAVSLPAAADHGMGFRAFLHGYEEVPSVSTRADGVFEARTNADNTQFDYVLVFEKLQGTVTQAHIHFAQKSVNGPIVVWLCGTAALPGPAGTPTCPSEGRVSGTITSAQVLGAPATQQLAAGEIGEVIDAMRAKAAYVNVHTSISPGGEIRGQVFRFR